MKKIILIFTMLVLSLSFAGERSAATLAENKALLKAVMNDVMLRGALAEAQKNGKCESTLVRAVSSSSTGTEFEVKINCTFAGDESTNDGDGILMINVKGRALFGNFLEHLLITVNRAGGVG